MTSQTEAKSSKSRVMRCTDYLAKEKAYHNKVGQWQSVCWLAQ